MLDVPQRAHCGAAGRAERTTDGQARRSHIPVTPEDVRFVECHFDYGTLSDARFSRVAFESCQLREADFHGADRTRTSFTDCDLERADFTRAKLQGVDVSRSHVSGITVGPAEVRGLVVNREQACALAALLGLVIRDES
jgi:uncharacterized protein YjbI with pentapeptide repeats